jgi:pimeloyl-ACP methyl ester carboxylesterase
VPPVAAGVRAVRSGLFLVEFLSDGRWHTLSAVTSPPVRAPLAAWDGARPVPADLYTSAYPARRPGLVLVHGLAHEGKDDPRVREAAALLARAGWAVAVPSVEGLMRLRLREDDAGAVRAAARALRAAGSRPIGLLAVSVGAGPALAAAADPALAGEVSAVLTLGGYASARELLRFTLTGGRAGASGERRPAEAAIAAFIAANADLVEESGQRLAADRDPAAVDALLARLPPSTQRLLDALSPERWLAGSRAPLFLVHGHDDPAVPVTESARLAAAAARTGREARLVVVNAVGHVEPGAATRLADLARLGACFYAFSVTSARPAP